MNFETFYNVVNDGDFLIISFKNTNVSNDEANSTFNELCNITSYNDFYNYCCEHECALV